MATKSPGVMCCAHSMFIISSKLLLVLSLFHLSNTILIIFSQLSLSSPFSLSFIKLICPYQSLSPACFSLVPFNLALDFLLIVYSFPDFFYPSNNLQVFEVREMKSFLVKCQVIDIPKYLPIE